MWFENSRMKTANYDIKRIIKHGNQLLMVISFNQQDIAKLKWHILQTEIMIAPIIM